MSEYFDALETRSADARAAALAAALPEQIARAKALSGYGFLADIDPAKVTSVEALAALPVLRKSEIGKSQAADGPLGGAMPRCPRTSSPMSSNRRGGRSMNPAGGSGMTGGAWGGGS